MYTQIQEAMKMVKSLKGTLGGSVMIVPYYRLDRKEALKHEAGFVPGKSFPARVQYPRKGTLSVRTGY